MTTTALACEAFRDGFLGQPANTITSLAFVIAGAAVLARLPAPVAGRWPYGLLVALVGVGSVVQHGPHPPWQAYAHDLPLVGVLAFVAVDAAADLTGRRLSAWWWLVPTAAAVPAVAAGPTTSMALQALLGVAAVGLSLLRAWRRPARRGRVVVAGVVLGLGALAGNLGDGPWCEPDSLWQGHAVWHVLAATALWWLTPVIGARGDDFSSRTQG